MDSIRVPDFSAEFGPVPPRIRSVFVSYSRKDSDLVQPLVSILRGVGASVAIDVAITPGSKWRTVIVNAIEACDAVLLFWCEHAAYSGEVAREWQHALKLGKSIIPIRLDGTDLKGPLAQYQAVDMKAFAVANHFGLPRPGSSVSSSPISVDRGDDAMTATPPKDEARGKRDNASFASGSLPHTSSLGPIELDRFSRELIERLGSILDR